jgi:hypothetical protein
MIEESGLAIIFVDGALPFRTAHHQFYYIGIMRADDAAPSWASALANSRS